MDIGHAHSLDPAPVLGFDGQKLTSLPVEAALRVSAYLQAAQEQGVAVSVRPGPQALGPCSHDAVVASYDPASRSLDVPGLALDGSGAGRIGVLLRRCRLRTGLRRSRGMWCTGFPRCFRTSSSPGALEVSTWDSAGVPCSACRRLRRRRRAT